MWKKEIHNKLASKLVLPSLHSFHPLPSKRESRETAEEWKTVFKPSQNSQKQRWQDESNVFEVKRSEDERKTFFLPFMLNEELKKDFYLSWELFFFLLMRELWEKTNKPNWLRQSRRRLGKWGERSTLWVSSLPPFIVVKARFLHSNPRSKQTSALIEWCSNLLCTKGRHPTRTTAGANTRAAKKLGRKLRLYQETVHNALRVQRQQQKRKTEKKSSE